MEKKLFSSKKRDASHKKLEKVLAEGKYPQAHCRETVLPDGSVEYSVWSEPYVNPNIITAKPMPSPQPPSSTGVVVKFSDDELKRIAEHIVALQTKKE